MHKLEVIDLLKSPILNSYAPRSTKDIKDPPSLQDLFYPGVQCTQAARL